jgi:hypothetical protein
LRLILALLLLLVPLKASDPWTKGDIALETAFVAVAVCDWMQTREIARHPEQYDEINPILFSRSPRMWQVNTFIPISIGLHILVMDLLPQHLRKYWAMVGILVEGNMVNRNLKMGIKIKF